MARTKAAKKDPNTETFKLKWRYAEITVQFRPDTCKSYREIYGVPMTQLKIQSPVALPITATGSWSSYIRGDLISEWGGASDYITGLLDHEADTSKWKKTEAGIRQLTLF